MTPVLSAFVVACMPVATREVVRLKRLGVPLEVDEGVQVALLGLIERVRSDNGAHARIIIRQSLVEEYGQVRNAVKRGGTGHRDRCRPRERAVHVELDEARHVGVSALEDETIARIDARRAMAKIETVLPAVLAPKTVGGSRQAKQQARARWFNRIRIALNDNTESAQEAA